MFLNKATTTSFDFFVVELFTYILEEFTYIYIYIMKEMMYIPNVYDSDVFIKVSLSINQNLEIY